MTTWSRGWVNSQPWAAGSAQIATVPLGHTLLRTHFGWSGRGTVTTLDSIPNLISWQMAFGLVTTDSTLDTGPPNAATGFVDVAPPTRRWLWWETRTLSVRTWGTAEVDVVTLETEPAAQPTDSEAQVLANVGAGGTLDVWLSWAPTTGNWPQLGYFSLNMWWSLLYR